MLFSNESIKPSRPNKPHIVFRKGYWRVSSLWKHQIGTRIEQRFTRAHEYVNKRNVQALREVLC